jgi:hypothetical protein
MTDPSDPTPERPGMQDATKARDENAEPEGQVSEVSRLGGDAISDGDSVHGAPSTESGRVDDGAAGGDSVPPENERDNEFERRRHKPDESVDDL